MRVEEIEKLLVLFYESKTTDSQEDTLKEYFETQGVPEHLLADKLLFKGLCTSSKPEQPYGLDEKLARLIDAKAEEEKRFFIKNKSKMNWIRIGGIAASLLFLTFIGYEITSYRTDDVPKDTFNNPRDAYAATKAALTEISANMNTGLNQLNENKKEVYKVNQEIKEEIQ
jgi:hypothetical protein